LVLAGCSETPNPSGLDDEPLLGRTARQTVDVIVVLNPDFAAGGHAANQGRARDIARSLGAAPTHAYGTAVFGFSGQVPEGRLAALDRDPRVLYWERDQVASIPLPRASAPRWCADNPSHPACGDDGTDDGGGDTGSQVTPWGVTRVGGSAAPTGVACVIDTGVDLDHPDLNVDVAQSRNFARRGKDSPDDGNGHGTHVAGTIAALDDGVGVVGVAAGASVVAVRVLGSSGSGYYSDVIAGVDYAATSSCDVANMSLGGPASNALDDAVRAAAGGGLLFALAAGNSSDDAGSTSPARVEHPNVRTISAIGEDDCLASFSNYGDVVDNTAPGVGVLSTWKGGGLETLSGTSMAAPHVAGLWLSGWTGNSEASDCSAPDGNLDPVARR
jgi:hypothetical protein